VPAVPHADLQRRADGESSAKISSRVECTCTTQLGRQGKPNAHLLPREIDHFCAVGDTIQAAIRRAMERLHLSAHPYHCILKLARTIADLDGAVEIQSAHVAEAIRYRPGAEET
jgi:magnesium chelatase family protein